MPGFAGGNGTTSVLGGVANWRQVPAGKRTSGDDTTTERTHAQHWTAWLASGTTAPPSAPPKNKSTADVKGGYVNDGLIAQGVWNGIINPFGAQTAAGIAAIEATQVVCAHSNRHQQERFRRLPVSNPDLLKHGLRLGWRRVRR